MHATASVISDAYAGPVLLSSVREAAAGAEGTDWVSQAYAGDGNCFRGIMVGICLEGVVMFGLYGIWQVFHIIR